MGQIDSGSKSNRLLASRRYTHNTFNTAQESFTNVLDLRSEEIYTRAHLIPSSSLPHSGSSQKMAVFSKNGQNVTKYWYRHKLTKSNTNNEVWFFLNPTGSDSGVGAQLINDNQEVNFISPKYGTSALANTTAEDSTPGYLAVVYKSTATNTSSLGGGDIVSTNDYQFDYKTGVLQFRSSTVDPTDSQYLYMSVYQYVGQNLRTGLEIEGPFTASNMSFGGDVTGSSSSTGSFGQVFVGDRLVFKDHQDSGEYIESDGTDLSINVGSSGDINIPANIGMTFGNDGEKIEGDGTNLTLAGGDINLTAEADVNIPSNIGLTFGDDGEKIEGDGTNMTIAGNKIILSTANITGSSLTTGSFGATDIGAGTLTANLVAGKVGIGEKLPAKELEVVGEVSASSTGSFGAAVIDGTTLIKGSARKLYFGDVGGEAISSDTTDLTITSGQDINLTATTDINVPANVGLTFGNDGEKIEGDGTDMTIASSGVLTLSSTGNTLVETVTFNNGNVTIPGDLTVTGDRIEAQVGSLQVADHTITVGSGSDSSALMQNAGIDWGVSGSVAFLRYRHAGTAISSSAFLEAPKLTVDTITIDAAEIDASGALDIDTGGDITLSATGDVNIPADIGLTFGNDGEKIEGDGTDLTIASSNLLNLTATTDVKIPVNVGLMFGTHEKIESDDTDLTITVGSGGDINIPADVGITFGDDGEKIEGDGTDLTISGNKIKLESTVISGSATSTGSFGYIKAQSGISSSGQVDINSSFAQLRLSDDGFSDFIALGQSGTVGYIKTSDGDNNFKFRRGNDNTDLVEIFFEAERTHISGSGGLDVTGHVTASGNISGSSTSTGSFARIVADNGAFLIDDAKVSGSSVTTGSFGRLELAGNANIDGNITLGGSINIGDADTDDITLGGEIKSNIIPDADATYDLGSTTKGWNDLHLGSGGVINLDGGDVTLTHSSNLVTITGGTTRVDKLEIDSANDHIDIDTDMVLTAAADITLTPGGANVKPGSDSAIDLGVSGTAFRELFVDAIDLNGQGSISIGGTGRIDLDGDDDTSIRASADDIITFEAGAVDIAQMTSTMAISGSSVSTGSFGRVETGRISGSSLNVSADVSASNVYVKDSKGLYADKIRRYSDSDTTTKIVLNDEVIKLHAGAADDESLRISGGASGLISGSATSTGSFARIVADGGAFIVDNAKVSGSSVSTGSFGKVLGDGSDLTNITDDSALAFSIVFGG